ncbi:hypothetical protein ACFPM7_08675 [Actinokineospora guangxiensis]|uniref:PH (Pleckstrin Homology) domain-containing protein n=1 Tax=Actinokineospora guangxiensis TaxID=1490288 RepID=A0ABW0EMG9_9PSEU
MATTFRPTPAFTLIYGLTTGVAGGLAVLGVHWVIDSVTGRWEPNSAVFASMAVVLLLTGVTAGSVRSRSLTLVPEGIVVVRDRVRTLLRWSDFEEVRQTGLLRRDELVFSKGQLSPADQDKPVAERVLDRMRRNGADRMVVVADFVTDWKSTEIHDAVKRATRG